MAIHPYHYLVINFLIPLGYYLLRFYLSMLRVRVIGEEIALGSLADHDRMIVAIWHQRFLAGLAYVTKFKHFKPVVMISQSKDGELAARLAKRLGLIPVRGSSSKGGTSALAAVSEALKKNLVAIHIVDGPRGPRGVVKPGLISIAQISGGVILPIIVSVEKAWMAGSWDRFLIPKPFSKVTIEWGQPFAVPRGLDIDSSEELRGAIQNNLSEGHAEADRNAGWDHPI
ncbi:MAG: lysophospholipid acyltransferase family protein [Deltaproteobacteria bacterium]|nr:lysophospholipid acyltransferase family protein [Deltaproteobacteria bacterium]MBW2633715.1 lysophospholipid acyltransferase family protein [Deltaproteobacteria bacterium]